MKLGLGGLGKRLFGRTASRAGGGQPPAYHAGDPMSQELAGWFPGLLSADAERLPTRDVVVARIRDQVRNSGWASGAISRLVDNVIGADLRLSHKPDFRALGLDADWAAEWSREVEGRWRLYAENPGRYCDSARALSFSGLMRLAYRHYKTDGDALAVLQWRPERVRFASAYATAIQVIDPDRLSNPDGLPDSDSLRGGVEIDPETGEATGYYMRRGHPGDAYLGTTDIYVWDYAAREQPWGRPIVVHFFDKQRADQTRGVGALAPVLERLKMVDRYDKAELAAAVLNAVLAAFIESPFDPDMMAGSLGDSLDYQEGRAEFHRDKRLSLGGVRIPILYPGEKLSFQRAERPASSFADFEAACLRNVASASGLSYEQLSMDWSRSNYSSARAALLEVWRGLGADRLAFAQGFATPIFSAWLEEALARGELSLPPGAPDFWTAKAAYCRCKWIGPGRGWVDPVKEAQASQIRMEIGLSTLEDEAAEQGRDYQEIIAQRARERAEWKAAGLPDPNVKAVLDGGQPAEAEEQ